MSRINLESIKDESGKRTYRATFLDGPFSGFVLETPDSATLRVRISEIENTGVDFLTFIEALQRPYFVWRMANAKVDNNFPGAEKTRAKAEDEIKRAAKAYARGLNMVAG